MKLLNLKRKTYLWMGAVLVVVIALAALAAGGGTEVALTEVKPGSIVRTVSDTGYVQPVEDFTFYATQSARVVELPVESGQAVSVDQTLVVLENLDLEIQSSDTKSQLSQAAAAVTSARTALETAKIQLKDAEDNLARVETLYQAGAVSPAEYDNAKSQVETGRQSVMDLTSRLNGAREQEASLSKSLESLAAKEQQLVVKSPLPGAVMSLPVKKGQVLTPGELVVSVAAPDQMEVKADILSDDLGEVQLGQRVVITAPVLGETSITGEVRKIYPQAEEKTSALGVAQRRVPVIIRLDSVSVLKPGYEVRAAIETTSRDSVLVVPRESVRTVGEGQKEVMAVVDGKVRHLPVQLGITSSETAEIIGGLQAGDKVITDGSQNLAEGTRVKEAAAK